MSIFKKVIFSDRKSYDSIIKNTLLAGTVLLSTVGQDVLAKEKSYVAVEPLTCDLVTVSYTHLTLPTKRIV